MFVSVRPKKDHSPVLIAAYWLLDVGPIPLDTVISLVLEGMIGIKLRRPLIATAAVYYSRVGHFVSCPCSISFAEPTQQESFLGRLRYNWVRDLPQASFGLVLPTFQAALEQLQSASFHHGNSSSSASFKRRSTPTFMTTLDLSCLNFHLDLLISIIRKASDLAFSSLGMIFRKISFTCQHHV